MWSAKHASFALRIIAPYVLTVASQQSRRWAVAYRPFLLHRRDARGTSLWHGHPGHGRGTGRSACVTVAPSLMAVLQKSTLSPPRKVAFCTLAFALLSQSRLMISNPLAA